MSELRHVDVRGLRLAYRTWGRPDAAPMILLHGATGNGGAWDGVAPALADRWRIYAPDMRGHAASDRPGTYSYELMRDDVLGFMDALGVATAVLVGHSMGGVIAYLLAQASPERVSGLVLEETPPPVPLGLPVPERPAEEVDYDWPFRPALLAQLNAPDPAWWDGLASITAPTLVIGGGEASFLPQQRMADMAARIPGGRMTSIPVGHGVHRDASEEFAVVVAEFCAGLLARE